MNEWHADTETVSRYAAGSLDEVNTYSVEAHLLGCERCRAAVGDSVRGFPDEQDRLERVWADVVDEVDRPRPGLVERALVRVGIRQHVARLLASTPSLRMSWLAAQAVVLAFAVAAARGSAGGAGGTVDGSAFLFLLVAPLLPLGGIVAAFGPGVDPTYEVGLASPLPSDRLLLLRAVAVLGASLVITGVAAVALPGLNWTAVAWLLPSIGLTASTLAVATWVQPLWAGATITAAWAAAVAVAVAPGGDLLAAFRAPTQLVFVAVIVLAVAVMIRRHDAFEMRSER